jgi:hypothetical protein
MGMKCLFWLLVQSFLIQQIVIFLKPEHVLFQNTAKAPLANSVQPPCSFIHVNLPLL